MTASHGNIEAIYPLSPMQEGILFHSLQAPSHAGLYFQQYSCRLDGALDVPSFEQAWRIVVDRHGALRSLFSWRRHDKLLQIVRRQIAPQWQHEDWSDVLADERGRRFIAWLEADRKRGFQFDRAPLMRFALFRHATETHRFVWSFHHVLLDGWSMRLVLEDVFRCYEALRRGMTPQWSPTRPYRDYVAWLQRQDLERGERFWARSLAGVERPTWLRLPHAETTAPAAESHREVEGSLSEDLTAALQSVARRHRLTLNTLLQGAWALLLSRYSGENDVVFGVTVSGRPHDLVGADEMVGLFINTLPLRVRIAADDELVPWLDNLQRLQSEINAYAYVPLVNIQRCSAVQPGLALFDTLLVFENHPTTIDTTGSSSLRSSEPSYFERSNYRLAVLAVPGRVLRFILVYDRSWFECETIQAMLGHLKIVLKAMAGDLNQRLLGVPLLSAAERQKILVEWNATRASDLSATKVHERIARQVRTTPKAVAVKFGNERRTYSELDARSERIAQQLRAAGVAPGTCVGIAVERSLEMIDGILGILKAGGAYVPLDPRQPSERLEFVLRDTRALALLTTRRFVHALPALRIATICLDDEVQATIAPASKTVAADGFDAQSMDAQAPADSEVDAPHAADASDLAYVIYTSGSTGKPKGVAVTHLNLAHSTAARMRYYTEPVSRFCLLSPFTGDSSIAGIFWTLCQGGTLILPAPRMELQVHEIARLIETERVSHVLMLPTLYSLILAHAQPDQLRSLKTVMVAGEACPLELARRHFLLLPSTGLYNEYGPTEATVWSTVCKIEPSAAPGRISIGRPIANTQAFIVDSYLRPVPVGVPGELLIGGPGVARGYLNQPVLTAEKFIVHGVDGFPPTRLYRTGDLARFRSDGKIEFLGRVDRQMKIRGHRIEPEEIEIALKENRSVRDAVAVLRWPAPPSNAELLLSALRRLGSEQGAELLTEVENLSEGEIDHMFANEL